MKNPRRKEGKPKKQHNQSNEGEKSRPKNCGQKVFFLSERKPGGRKSQMKSSKKAQKSSKQLPASFSGLECVESSRGHSIIRDEIWRHLSRSREHNIDNYRQTRYKILYGIFD